MDYETRKPPLGLMPRHMWAEQIQNQRAIEVLAAIHRYMLAGVKVPHEWFAELERFLSNPRGEVLP